MEWEAAGSVVSSETNSPVLSGLSLFDEVDGCTSFQELDDQIEGDWLKWLSQEDGNPPLDQKQRFPLSLCADEFLDIDMMTASAVDVLECLGFDLPTPESDINSLSEYEIRNESSPLLESEESWSVLLNNEIQNQIVVGTTSTIDISVREDNDNLQNDDNSNNNNSSSNNNNSDTDSNPKDDKDAEDDDYDVNKNSSARSRGRPSNKENKKIHSNLNVKTEKKKIQNLKSAKKYRSKKKQGHSVLFEQAEILEKKNAELKQTVNELTGDIAYLKALLFDICKYRLDNNEPK